MDYKERIEQLRRFGSYYPITGPIENEAADAIETLLAERDAVMKELHGDCDKCRYFGFYAQPCCNCYINGGLIDYWQWRGPQKEDKHDAD